MYIITTVSCPGISCFIVIIKGQCYLLWVQEHQRPPSLPLSHIQAHPALEQRNTEYQTTCHSLHHILDTWSCSLTLGPGIPCSPWKTWCIVSVTATGANNKLDMNSFHLDLERGISTHHGSWGPGNPWRARWARWAWLGDHLNLSTVEITRVKREQDQRGL